MRCPGSIAMSRDIEDTGSDAADEGTLAHQIAAEVLVDPKYKGMVAKHPLAKTLEDWSAGNCDYLQQYVDYVKGRAKDCFMYVEVALDLSPWLGEGGFGTSDVVLYNAESRLLSTIDLKFGRGNLVFANERDGDGMQMNPQLATYALGAHAMFNFLDVDEVELIVHQPRRDHISTALTTPGRLSKFGIGLRASAQRVDTHPHVLMPGEVQCKWCPARAVCEARSKWHLDAFQTSVEKMSPGEMAAVLGQLDDMRAWCNDIEERATALLLDNADSVPGWKVVAGRSVRQWNDQAPAVLQRLLGEEQMYERKMITITAAEKLLGKGEKNLLEPATVKTTGKPVLVPESDPRPLINDTRLDGFTTLDSETGA